MARRKVKLGGTPKPAKGKILATRERRPGLFSCCSRRRTKATADADAAPSPAAPPPAAAAAATASAAAPDSAAGAPTSNAAVQCARPWLSHAAGSVPAPAAEAGRRGKLRVGKRKASGGEAAPSEAPGKTARGRSDAAVQCVLPIVTTAGGRKPARSAALDRLLSSDAPTTATWPPMSAATTPMSAPRVALKPAGARANEAGTTRLPPSPPPITVADPEALPALRKTASTPNASGSSPSRKMSPAITMSSMEKYRRAKAAEELGASRGSRGERSSSPLSAMAGVSPALGGVSPAIGASPPNMRAGGAVSPSGAGPPSATFTPLTAGSNFAAGASAASGGTTPASLSGTLTPNSVGLRRLPSAEGGERRAEGGEPTAESDRDSDLAAIRKDAMLRMLRASAETYATPPAAPAPPPVKEDALEALLRRAADESAAAPAATDEPPLTATTAATAGSPTAAHGASAIGDPPSAVPREDALVALLRNATEATPSGSASRGQDAEDVTATTESVVEVREDALEALLRNSALGPPPTQPRATAANDGAPPSAQAQSGMLTKPRGPNMRFEVDSGSDEDEPLAARARSLNVGFDAHGNGEDEFGVLQVPPPPPPRKIRSSPSVGQGDAKWSNPSPSAPPPGVVPSAPPPGVVAPSDVKSDAGAAPGGAAPGREPPPKAKLAEGWQRAQSEEAAAEVTA